MLKLFREKKSSKNKIAGYNINHLIIEIDDLEHLSVEEQGQLLVMLDKIEKGRRSQGKTEKVHLVIDSTKEYIDKIVKVMKSNNDWGK